MNDKPLAQRATPEGTARYRARFADCIDADFFRDTSIGTHVSSLGIGTYLGDSTEEHDTAYNAAIARAIELGVNLVDTAINYRGQRSEQSVCRGIEAALAAGASRDELVVCTKGGYLPLDRVPPTSREDYQAYVKREFFDTEILHPDDVVAGGHSLAPRFLRYCLAKSRQNLGLRTIDVYYIHNPEQQLAGVDTQELMARLRAAFAFLEQAVERGEVGAYGIATWDGLRAPPATPAHLSLEDVVGIARELAGDSHHLRFVQLPVNLAMQEAFREPTQRVGGKSRTALEAASDLGLSAVASATLMQARLTSGLPESLRGHFTRCETDAQRAIAFNRGIPGLTATLVGMKSAAHVNENVASAIV